MTLSVSMKQQLGHLALDLAFEAPVGITVLFGRSGSGKTTIVNTVAGLLTPETGRICVQDRVLLDTKSGENLPPHKRRLGYIFQEGRLFPHLNVRQNLTYGRWMAKAPADRSEFDRIVEMLGIGELLERRPATLSGGEKQRVGIGRALLANPSLILADEPLASLDEERKQEILPFFERLRDEVSIPILYVSHSAAEVARLATTVVALDNGKVARQGPAVEVLGDPMVTPTGARAAGALIEAVVVMHHADGLTELEVGGVRLLLPRVSAEPGSRLRVRIPAQEVILSRQAPTGLSALNILPGTVETIRGGDGPGALVSVKTPAGSILARVTRRSTAALNLQVGGTVHAIVKTLAIAPEDVGR
ncbi:molybdenum ABC transporter ATP-binding protein [Roseibium sediminis]|uniref:molybdenum ABC transporter ATP-binding protein n=1 Tax=Roseibium sediminis TaxID=1775174 RepID=UPI00123DA9B4|nr:molybdenum ABC transporter ATP-binding protein [Roseibium sediminis]